MEMKYYSLEELYSLIGLPRYQIARRLHVSTNTMRKWKSVEDVPGSLLLKLENLVIYKSNRLKAKKRKKDIESKILQEIHNLVKKEEHNEIL